MPAAMVQNVLRAALLARLANRDQGVEEMFFGPTLGGFETQIKLAYAVGLLPQNAFADLQCINDIRNEFAQWDLPEDGQSVSRILTFESERNVEKARNLNWATNGQEIGDPAKVIPYAPGPKRWYLNTCSYLANGLGFASRPSEVELFRNVPPEYLIY